jgi:hypothetical protein
MDGCFKELPLASFEVMVTSEGVRTMMHMAHQVDQSLWMSQAKKGIRRSWNWKIKTTKKPPHLHPPTTTTMPSWLLIHIVSAIMGRFWSTEYGHYYEEFGGHEKPLFGENVEKNSTEANSPLNSLPLKSLTTQLPLMGFRSITIFARQDTLVKHWSWEPGWTEQEEGILEFPFNLSKVKHYIGRDPHPFNSRQGNQEN